MKFSVSDLKQDRQWRSAIGMSQAQFKTLLGLFEKSYVEHYKARLCEKKVDVKIGSALTRSITRQFFW